MHINKYYSQATPILVSKFPAWSAIVSNPLSIGQRLINLFAIEYEELLVKFNNMYNEWNIYTANIDEIYETWVVENQDVVSEDATDVPIGYASAFVGHYPIVELDPETQVYMETFDNIKRPIIIVDGDSEEYFYKHPPTAYTARRVYQGNSDERYLACQYHNGVLRIKSSIEGMEKTIRFNYSVDPTNEDNLTDLSSDAFDELYVPNYEDITNSLEVYTNHRTPSQMILDNVRVFKRGTSPYEQPTDIDIPEDYYFVGSGVLENDYYKITKPWETENALYSETYDFDNDGVINEAELYLLTKQLNRNRYEPDMTDEIWQKLYAKYDLDNDGYITNADIIILKKYMGIVSDASTNVILFKQSGQYIIRYNTIINGGVSGYTIFDNNLQEWRNDTMNGSFSQLNPSGYVDLTYQNTSDTFYYTDTLTKSVMAELYDELANRADYYKINLPVTSTHEELRGITTARDGLLYAIGSDPEHNVGKLYCIDTHSDDIRGTVTTLNVYPQLPRSTYFDVTRPNLPANAYGITNFIGDRLFVTSGNEVYLLEPIYDVAMYSSGTDRVHFRSWHKRISNAPDDPLYFEAVPFWNRVWNEFDEAAWTVGIERLLGESNQLLKRRIIDVHEHYAYPTEQGYINGIHRDLGMARYDLLQDHLIVTLKKVPLDPTFYSFDIIPSAILASSLSITNAVPVPVTNSANITIYYKYDLYGDNQLTLESDVLLATLDQSVLLLYATINPEYGDAVRVKYQYIDNQGNTQTADEITIIKGKIVPPEIPLEIFRITNQERFALDKYGYYQYGRIPTEKLLKLVKKLKSVDNTTFRNYIANVSRYDTWTQQYSGKNAIPQFWQ